MRMCDVGRLARAGAVVGCLAGLLACSPTFNWRDVPLDGGALRAQLPCKPERAERLVPLTRAGVTLQLLSCEAGGITYALAWARPDLSAANDSLAQVLDRWQQAGWTSLRQPGPAGAQAPAGWAPWPLARRRAEQLRAWQGSGLDHRGAALQARQAYLAHAGVVYQAAVYGARLPTEAVSPFFDALVLPTNP